MIRQSSKPCDALCRNGGDPCAKCDPQSYYAIAIGGAAHGFFRSLEAAKGHALMEARFGDEFQMVRVLAWAVDAGAYTNTVFACRLERGTVKEYQP